MCRFYVNLVLFLFLILISVITVT